MANLDNNNNNKSLNFGIEDTIDMGAGDKQLLSSLLETESSTASPDDITSIEAKNKVNAGDNNDNDNSNAAPPVPDDIAKNPEALADFLLGNEEEEEEEDDDDDDAVKKAALTTTETTTVSPDNEEEEGVIAFDKLANELANLGVFSRGEGEEENIADITNADEFLERFKVEKQRAANGMISEFLGQFGQDYQDAFQAIFVNGADPKDYFSKATEVEDFENIDLSIETNQEKVVRRTLAEQGFEKDDIEAEVNKLKEYGDLEDVSKRHHKVIVKKEKEALAKQSENAKQATMAKQAQKQKYVENVRGVLTDKIKAKDFDGIPVNVKVANELQDFLLVDKWKTASGETLTDFDKTILDLKLPENHEQKVKVALLLKLLEKDPTLSTIQKRGVSTQSSELFKDVARQKSTASRNNSSVRDNKGPAGSWFKN